MRRHGQPLFCASLLAIVLMVFLALGGCEMWRGGRDVGTPTDTPAITRAPRRTPAPTPSALVSTSVLDSSQWGDYFETLGGEHLAFAQSFAQKEPSSLRLAWSSVSGKRTRVYTDTATIIAAFNALAVLDVGAESQVISSDDDSLYTFVMADGTRRAFSFNSGNAYVGRGYYKLNNTAAFSVFEKRLRSEYDEGYGNITQQQYDSFVVGETWWRDVYDLLGEPLTLERNDEYTSLAVTYMAWDGSVALLKFVSYEGTRNACQLVSKRIGLPTSYIEEHS